jgi:hypothetical protein
MSDFGGKGIKRNVIKFIAFTYYLVLFYIFVFRQCDLFCFSFYPDLLTVINFYNAIRVRVFFYYRSFP